MIKMVIEAMGADYFLVETPGANDAHAVAMSYHTKALFLQTFPDDMRVDYLHQSTVDTWKAVHSLTLINGADPLSLDHAFASLTLKNSASVKGYVSGHRTKQNAICSAVPPGETHDLVRPYTFAQRVLGGLPKTDGVANLRTTICEKVPKKPRAERRPGHGPI